MGLNDCPAATWDAIDLKAVRADLGVANAQPNGPRYWVLDAIEPGEIAGSLEVRNLGGVEMRSLALVDLTTVDATESTAYREVSVERDTLFTFRAGREVYELTAPDGSIYVMQSFSQQVVALQELDDLASLADRLDLPDGWSFGHRVLSEDLYVEALDGMATVVTDEFMNTYQLRSRG